MTEREKLIELLKESKLCSKRFDDQYSDGTIAIIADHLIANGVIIKSDCEDCASKTTRVIDKLHGEIAKLRKAQVWIPVTERLPETQVEVLTYSECNGVRSACLLASDEDTNMWYLCRTDKLSIAVTHWMPLPQPPKGE